MSEQSNVRRVSSWSPDEVQSTTTSDSIGQGQKEWVPPTPLSQFVQSPNSKSSSSSSSSSTSGVIANGNIPKNITSMTVAEEAYRAADGSMMSLVTVTFTAPSDPNWAGIIVWFTGYNGSSNPQEMTQGTTSPVQFLCETTHESIIVTAQSIGPSGTTATLSGSPSEPLTLSGVTSGPPGVTITQTTTTTPIGFQFTFQEVSGLSANEIEAYIVVRNTSNNVAGATAVRTFPQGSGNGTIVFQDVAPNGTTYYYWVYTLDTSGHLSSAVSANTGLVYSGSQLNSLGQLINADQVAADGATYARIIGKELVQNHLPGYPPSNGINNPLFNDQSVYNTGQLLPGTFVVNGWKVTQNDGQCFEVGVEFNGLSTASNDLYIGVHPGVVLPANSSFTCRVHSHPLMSFRLTDVVCGGCVSNGNTQLGLPAGLTCYWWPYTLYTTQDEGENGGIGGTVRTQTKLNGGPFLDAWTTPCGSGNNPAPNGTSVMCFGIAVSIANPTGSAITVPADQRIFDARFTNCYMGIATTPSTGLAQYGSVPQNGASPLSYTDTSTSITFSGTFNGFRTDYADTQFSGSYSNAVTGLSPGAAYYFYAYWDDNTAPGISALAQSQSVQFCNWGSGSNGTAYTALSGSAYQYCLRSDHIPIGTGPISVTLPSSGTGGGSGGGRNTGGTCPREDMVVHHKTLGHISCLRLFEEVTKDPFGEHYILDVDDRWAQVIDVQRGISHEWIEADFGVEKAVVTMHHSWLTILDEIVPACDLHGHKIRTTRGVATHLGSRFISGPAYSIRITVDGPHTYLVGHRLAQLQTHNTPPLAPC